MEVEDIIESYNRCIDMRKKQIEMYKDDEVNFVIVTNAEIEILKLVIKDLKKIK